MLLQSNHAVKEMLATLWQYGSLQLPGITVLTIQYFFINSKLRR